MLMIRLARMGARKQPHYRVVVIEKVRARNGRSVEVVGTYNPRSTPANIELKRDRIEYWVSKGAKMSDRVSQLMSKPVPAATESNILAPLDTQMLDSVAAGTGFDIRALIEQIAKALVDEPEQVAVEVVEEDGGTVLELKVAPSDVGKVIGKQGRTARAMRTLLGAASMKLHKRYSLEILE